MYVYMCERQLTNGAVVVVEVVQSESDIVGSQKLDKPLTLTYICICISIQICTQINKQSA